MKINRHLEGTTIVELSKDDITNLCLGKRLFKDGIHVEMPFSAAQAQTTDERLAKELIAFLKTQLVMEEK